jgi:hypothetical protein
MIDRNVNVTYLGTLSLFPLQPGVHVTAERGKINYRFAPRYLLWDFGIQSRVLRKSMLRDRYQQSRHHRLRSCV